MAKALNTMFQVNRGLRKEPVVEKKANNPSEPTTPNSIPTTAATKVSMMDSPSIIIKMSLLLHPTAFKTPISRVLSYTDIIITFIMPIPPIIMAKTDMAAEAGAD